MNRKKKSLGYQMKYIYLLLACLVMAGCAEEEKWGTGNGTGFLVSLDDVSVEVTTRAASEEFNLVVTKDGTSDSKSYTLTAGSTQFVPVSVGTYNIKATSATELDGVSWNPYYVTEEKDVEIAEEDTQKSITLTAKYGCALVSVTFPEGLNEIFKDYHVTVAANTHSLELTPSRSQAYVEAGTEVSLSFGGTKLSGEVVKDKPLTHGNLPSTFAAADFYKITLAMGDDLTLDIAKVEEKTIDITEEIPLDWLPKPKMEANGFDSNNTLTFVETEAKTPKLDLKLSHALQDIKFKFNFQDEQFAGSLDANKEYLLSNADDKAAIESALGITLPEIGAETGSLDFSPLVAKLQTNAGTTTNNAVEIDVKANNRWSSEDTEVNRTYTFVCNKPEFSVAVQPGNCWSREFTVDEVTVTGNADAEKIKSNLVYQYYDGTNWVECKTRDNVAGRTQQFSGTAENITKKDYKVRALYRGAIASAEVNAELETPEQLPNSGFEDWYWNQIHEDSRLNPFDSDTYTIYPWSRDEKSPFWNTNNDFTTRNRGSFSNVYNSFPAVSFVDEAHGGSWAVELRNTSNGRGNTLPSNVLSMNKVAGELFVGDINVTTGGTDATPSGDKYTITEGRSFLVRPTALKFWYKYAPLNTDTWRVRIQLLDSGDNVIIEKTVDSSEVQSNWKEETIELDYLDEIEYAKCAKICIYFASTITVGDNMQYEKSDYTIWLDSERSFSNIWHGSTLTIDDISLVYDK